MPRVARVEETKTRTIEIACCGTFQRVASVPWTCPTCQVTHLGAAPPTFAWQAHVQWDELRQAIAALQTEIDTRVATIKRLEAQQALLMHYLDLEEETCQTLRG
jgi:ribosomal protein L37AE/L43A